MKGVDEEVDHNLGTYLATVLGVKAGITKDIQAYVAALRSEGCDMPEDFAGLEIEELKGEPFAFKRLHLKKVALWRANEEKGGCRMMLMIPNPLLLRLLHKHRRPRRHHRPSPVGTFEDSAPCAIKTCATRSRG